MSKGSTCRIQTVLCYNGIYKVYSSKTQDLNAALDKGKLSHWRKGNVVLRLIDERLYKLTKRF